MEPSTQCVIRHRMDTNPRWTPLTHDGVCWVTQKCTSNMKGSLIPWKSHQICWAKVTDGFSQSCFATMGIWEDSLCHSLPHLYVTPRVAPVTLFTNCPVPPQILLATAFFMETRLPLAAIVKYAPRTSTWYAGIGITKLAWYCSVATQERSVWWLGIQWQL